MTTRVTCQTCRGNRHMQPHRVLTEVRDTQLLCGVCRQVMEQQALRNNPEWRAQEGQL